VKHFDPRLLHHHLGCEEVRAGRVIGSEGQAIGLALGQVDQLLQIVHAKSRAGDDDQRIVDELWW
jgi:hypothetical protein